MTDYIMLFWITLMMGVIIHYYRQNTIQKIKTIKFMFKEQVIFTAELNSIYYYSSSTSIRYKNRIILNAALFSEISAKNVLLSDNLIDIQNKPENELYPYHIIIE